MDGNLREVSGYQEVQRVSNLIYEPLKCGDYLRSPTHIQLATILSEPTGPSKLRCQFIREILGRHRQYMISTNYWIADYERQISTIFVIIFSLLIIGEL